MASDGLAAAFQQIEDLSPLPAERLKRRFVDFGVPANRTMGIRAVTADTISGFVELRLPPRQRNLNVAGTIAGSVVEDIEPTVRLATDPRTTTGVELLAAADHARVGVRGADGARRSDGRDRRHDRQRSRDSVRASSGDRRGRPPGTMHRRA